MLDGSFGITLVAEGGVVLARVTSFVLYGCLKNDGTLRNLCLCF